MTHTIRISAIAVAAATAFAVPAIAGGLDEPVVAPVAVPAPPPAFVSRFAGGYAGAQIGYGYADTEVTDNTDTTNNNIPDAIQDRVDNTIDTINAIGEDGDGLIGGVHAGYLWNSGQFVFGGEVDYDFSDIQFDNNGGEITGIARAKLKGGYDFGSTLLYANLGGAYADGEINTLSGDDFGWLIGAGFDTFVTETITIGAEVNYQDFGEFDDTNTDLSLTTVAARVSFHF